MINIEGWQKSICQPSKIESQKEKDLRLHHLDKTEHFIRSLVGIVLFILEHIVFRLKILAPKLIDLKTALVDVEMNIAFFKIGSAGLPNLGFGMQCLNRLPRAVADAFGVLLGGNE